MPYEEQLKELGLLVSCTEDSASGCNTPGEVSPAQSRWAGPPPLPCWPRLFQCSPGCSRLSRLQGYIADMCPACHPPVPQVLFDRAVLHPYILQLLLVVEFAMTQAQDLVLGFAEPREVHLGPVNPQLVIICQALMGSVDIPLPS